MEFCYKQGDWEGTTQFQFHNGCITTLQGVRHVPDSRYNFISLGVLQSEGFNFSSEDDLMEVSREVHVKFQGKRVGNVYVLQNSKVTVGGLQLSSASKAVVVEQSELSLIHI